MTFDDLKRSLCSVLETGKIGTPVSMRVHLHIPKTRVDVYSALASIMKLCHSVTRDVPLTLIARQTSGGTQLNVLVTLENGRTILATVGSGSVKRSVLELLLIGNHGVVRLEGEDRIDELLLTNDDEVQQWKTAVARSLNERKQIAVSKN
ncbi:MAG: hypothetical protein IH899_21855 [Planctomycetes bacterium]|nr:hypothetical protein [Planctomycetota bacterium]